jgi:hypothetical protein
MRHARSVAAARKSPFKGDIDANMAEGIGQGLVVGTETVAAKDLDPGLPTLSGDAPIPTGPDDAGT